MTVYPAINSKSPASPFTLVKVGSSDINIELLNEARQIMAEVVKIHGDAYLPAFIRIHDELQKLEANQSKKNLALQIANSRS